MTEAKDISRKQFGRERLLGILSGGSREPGELLRGVLEGVRSFAREAPQNDDITMLAIRFDGKPAGPTLESDRTSL